MQGWAPNEAQYYTYSSNSCQSGKVCGHYTQVVWHNSYKLGCGKKTCNPVNGFEGNGKGDVYVCQYMVCFSF